VLEDEQAALASASAITAVVAAVRMHTLVK
jgi:hypothetical protein